jgi:hypothetical protein
VRFGLAKQVAEVAEQCQGPLVAGGGREVSGQLLHDPQVVVGIGPAMRPEGRDPFLRVRAEASPAVI